MIIDGAADSTMMAQSSWHIFEYTGYTVEIGSRFATHAPSLDVCHGATVLVLEGGTRVLAVVYWALLDPDSTQTESLLLPHQAREHHVVIDDVADTHLTTGGRFGTQSAWIGEDQYPFCFDGKMMYWKICKPTPEELENLPVIELTSPDMPSMCCERQVLCQRHFKSRVPMTLDRWRRCFAWLPDDRVRATLTCTTQLIPSVEAETRDRPRDHIKARLAALHPRRLRGTWYTDTFFCPLKSVRGHTCFQLFIGTFAKFPVVYPMRKESNAPNAYRDFVRSYGAPELLKRDNSQTQTGADWISVSRQSLIAEALTEPFHSNQNLAERYGGDLKGMVVLTLAVSQAPLKFWCYAVEWCAVVLRNAAISGDCVTAHTLFYGDTNDVSYLRFYFWEEVEFLDSSICAPFNNMISGRFLGIAENAGDAFTFLVLPESELSKSRPRPLVRSVVRSRDPHAVPPQESSLPSMRNLDLDSKPFNFDSGTKLRAATQPSQASCSSPQSTPPTASDNVIQPASPSIEPATTIPLDLPEGNHVPGGQPPPEQSDPEEPFPHPDSQTSKAFRDLINLLSKEEASNHDEFTKIVGHKRHDGVPMFQVEWLDRSTTWVDFESLRSDHPDHLAAYIVEHRDVDGYKTGKHFRWARHFQREMQRLQRRLVLRACRVSDSTRTTRDRVLRRAATGSCKKRPKNPGRNDRIPTVQYGVQVPRNIREAFELDKKNGNTYWKDAIEKEINALLLLDCFEFQDPSAWSPPSDYQYAPLRLIFAVKQDGRRKARLVAGGHVIDASDVPTYASVVQSLSTRLLHLIADKNRLYRLCGDVGNAFVNAYTNEKVYCRAGPEFGDREGCWVIIRKALYGLKSSAERWHAKFADSLRELGFSPTRFDRDVWIRDAGDHYEYICTHVDDFCIFSRDPWRHMRKLQEEYTIKDAGPPNYYLGNDFRTISTGHLAVGCSTYLKNALARIEEKFGTLKPQRSPMATNDHPEDDESPLLSEETQRDFQMLLGIAQWLNLIGRFDICFAVSSLSRFNALAREGHLTRILHVFGYLKKYRDFHLVVDSRPPIFDPDATIPFDIDWGDEYAGANPEELDPAHPPPKGGELPMTYFVDADHAHDHQTRRSITGLICLIGCTPVHWISKRQGTVETSTYGAEFNAMRTATEEIMAHRYILRSLGVPVSRPTILYGDNMGVIQNATMPLAQCKKKHNALSFHRVREAAAHHITDPRKIDTNDNYADIFTKAIASTVFIGHVHELMWRPRRVEEKIQA